MKVSKDLDLAARLLMHLATKPSNTGTTVDELEKAFSTPVDLLEDLLGRLRTGKILKTRSNVGKDEYLLRQPATNIRLGMVVDAIRPRDAWEVSFAHDDNCDLVSEEEGRPAWDELEKVILKGLKDYTLDHLSWDTTFQMEP